MHGGGAVSRGANGYPLSDLRSGVPGMVVSTLTQCVSILVPLERSTWLTQGHRAREEEENLVKWD
jgi:hypothetical protein